MFRHWQLQGFGDKYCNWLDSEMESETVMRTAGAVTLVPGTGHVQDSEFRLLADNIPTLCWMADADGSIFWYNRRWHDYCGSSPESMAGWGWQVVHDPAVLPSVLDRWTASIRTGQPFEMTFPLRGGDGNYRPFLTRVQPLYDAHGNVWRWFGVNTDVSAQAAVEVELAEALAAKEMLLHEVNHRVKNSLQLATSLLHLQAGSTPSAELRQGLLDARSRIAVVAGVHRQLYASGLHDRIDVVAYLRELTTATVDALGNRETINLIFNHYGSVSLPLTHAVSLALITSELITNAVKYAFGPRTTGTVTVSIRSRNDGFELEVADDGRGLPQDFDIAGSSGLGTRIVTALVRQVRGTIDIIAQPSGTCFRVTVLKKGQ